MTANSRFKIHGSCRSLPAKNFEKRRATANSFVLAFVKRIAPHKRDDNSNQQWTRVLRSKFIDLCPNDCSAYPPNAATRKGEFLVDYTWEEKAGGKRLLLAAESEWASVGWGRTSWSLVDQDLEKLLAVKAPFKVLIFSSKNKHKHRLLEGKDFSFEYVRKKLKDSLEPYAHHLAGEVYIFIDFPETREPEGDGIYRSFTWVVEQTGRNTVMFSDGPNGKLHRYQ